MDLEQVLTADDVMIAEETKILTFSLPRSQKYSVKVEEIKYARVCHHDPEVLVIFYKEEGRRNARLDFYNHTKAEIAEEAVKDAVAEWWEAKGEEFDWIDPDSEHEEDCGC